LPIILGVACPARANGDEKRAARNVVGAVDRTGEGRWIAAEPADPAVGGEGHVVPRGIRCCDIAAGRYAVQPVPERQSCYSGSLRSIDHWRLVAGPVLPPIAGHQHPRLLPRSRSNPRVLFPYSDEACPARRKGALTRGRGRHPLGRNPGPGGSAICCRQNRQLALNRVANHQTAPGVPESETVVEPLGVLVGELEQPAAPSVDRFVDPGAIAEARAEQPGCSVVHRVHVAEFERIRPVDLACDPGDSAVGGPDIGAAGPAGPNHLVVHDTDGLKPEPGPALLGYEVGGIGPGRRPSRAPTAGGQENQKHQEL
jgi:hypothetical protein